MVLLLGKILTQWFIVLRVVLGKDGYVLVERSIYIGPHMNYLILKLESIGLIRMLFERNLCWVYLIC